MDSYIAYSFWVKACASVIWSASQTICRKLHDQIKMDTSNKYFDMCNGFRYLNEKTLFSSYRFNFSNNRTAVTLDRFI